MAELPTMTQICELAEEGYDFSLYVARPIESSGDPQYVATFRDLMVGVGTCGVSNFPEDAIIAAYEKLMESKP